MSADKTTFQHPVHFPTADKEEASEPHFTLRKLVKGAQFKQFLPKKNVLILGKVGFFDLILKELIITYKNGTGREPVTIHTEEELADLISKAAKEADSKYLLVLVPTVETRDRLNHLVSGALATSFPVWLVALPSQVHKQLLLSFNWFFIPSSPAYEIKILADITPIADDDINVLNTQNDIVAIFAADQRISNLGVPERLGTVIYIHELR